MITPALMLLSAGAQAQGPLSETDSLYIGNRVTLSVSMPRQLTIDAPIRDFDWSPDGRRIAYFTASDPADHETAIAVAQPDGGQARIYYRGHLTDDAADHTASFVEQLVGWSSDGKYVAFIANATDPMSGVSMPSLSLIDVASGSMNAALYPFPITDRHRVFSITNVAWAPKSDLIAFTADISGDEHRVLVYDPATATTQDFFPASHDTRMVGWQKGNHVLAVINREEGHGAIVAADVTTGQLTPSSKKEARQVQAIPSDGSASRLDMGAAGIATISLLGGPEDNVLEEVKDRTGKTHGGVIHLWASVTPDRPAPVPPKSPGAGKKPTPLVLLLDSYRLLAWNEPVVKIAPQQTGLPNRARVAYLISGDLYLVDITPRAPSVQELIAAGEPLTCREEQQLAVSDAKQLGLAVIQYTQDYDEHYPPAGNFHNEVYPYIKTDEVFQVDGHTFQFSLDGDTLASLDDPAHTELGDFDLPCGRVVAYADGSVKVLKPGD